MGALSGFIKGLASGMKESKAGTNQKQSREEMEDLNKRIGMLELGPGGEGPIRPLGSMRKGGRIKKTGLYLLHKNEEVMPARKAKSRKASRCSGRR